MFDKRFITTAISRSAETALDRRRFFKAAGIAGLGVGATYLAGSATASAGGSDGSVSDSAILNFALNLEYLEAEFYQRAVFGIGLPSSLTGGKGTQGTVTGGRQVTFQTPAIRSYAREIAQDELAHVTFLRDTLGSAAVAEPSININDSFTAVAMAAGLIGPGETFDVYANEESFLLGAFVFEDVGVTAYKGAAPLISNKTYLEAAAGILAVEAYHASNIRTTLISKGLAPKTVAISDARDSLDGPTDDDQGALLDGKNNVVPTDSSGIAFSRTTAQVLNVVYLTPNEATSGGFFPAGVNGTINQSGDNG